jgi:hypothetical protein
MKNYKSRIIATVAVLLVASFLVMSCGGGGAKGLAKQTYDLLQQELDYSDTTSPELKKYMKKAAALQVKVVNLSDKDKKVYEEELNALISAASWSAEEE